LEESCVDIIEFGYLDKNGAKDSTLFNDISSLNDILSNVSKDITRVVMIDLFSFDVSDLPNQADTEIDGIRLAFHKKDLKSAIEIAKQIIDLGYLLFFQPMVTKNYSDDEFLSLIKEANKLDIHAFYIVDSFGSMSLPEFRKYVDFADTHLRKGLHLGYHSHNNMQLAFSNAIDFCNSNIDRAIIIDSSIYGMGRGAGNLYTELIMDYLNNNLSGKYEIFPLLEVIDGILNFYLSKSPWGFSPEQYLSASLECHPNYASYLVNKKTNYMTDIKRILEKIPRDKRVSFDKELVDDLYMQLSLEERSNVSGHMSIPNDRNVLLVASGSSVIDNLELIRKKSQDENYLTIALNHKPPLDCDYYFFSNQRRFDDFKSRLPLEKCVITTNIEHDHEVGAVINFKDIAYVEKGFVTNVAILMINHLINNSVRAIEIAGLDGYQSGIDNYSYNETNIVSNDKLFMELNQTVQKSLDVLKSFISIELITPSVYSNLYQEDS